MSNPQCIVFSLGLAWIGILVNGSNSQEPGRKITFDDQVKPVFQQRCATCHNPDRQSGGLDLTNYTNLMTGGGSGQVIEPGDAGNSYLFKLITHEESPEMPPAGTRIPDAEIQMIESWINAGALENKGSVARNKTSEIVVTNPSIGVRPEVVARPPRMSLEPCFHSPRAGVITSLATSPWTHVAALAAAKQVLLYDTKTLQLIGSLPFPEGRANALRFSRNGDLLIAGGGRHGLTGKVVVWDVATTDRVMEVGSEVDNVLAADISSDHSMIALGGPQKMLRVYSTDSGELMYEIKKHTDWITSVEFSPDGVLLASADRNGGLQIWESYSGNEYLTLGGHGKAITDLSWRSDSNVLATAGDDAAVRLWELENGRQIKSWTAHGQSVTSVKFKRDGLLVSCGRDRLAKLWQQDGKLVRQFEGLNEIGVAVAACDESGVVLSASLSGSVRVWSSADGSPVGELISNPPVLSDRLQQASAELTQALAVVQPLESQLASVTARLAELEDQIQQQQISSDRFVGEMAELQNEIDSGTQQVEAAEQQRIKWQQELGDTESVIPLVAEAMKSATAASNLLRDDVELKSTSQQLAARHQTYVGRVKQLKGQIEDSKTATENRSSEIIELQTHLKATQSRLSGAREDLSQLNADLEPVRTEKDELVAKLAEAKKKELERQSRVDRWKDEIAFDAALKRLLEELSSAQDQIEEKEAVLESAGQKLQQAQAEYDQRVNDKQESERAARAVKEKLEKLRNRQ